MRPSRRSPEGSGAAEGHPLGRFAPALGIAELSLRLPAQPRRHPISLDRAGVDADDPQPVAGCGTTHGPGESHQGGFPEEPVMYSDCTLSPTAPMMLMMTPFLRAAIKA